jgi:hypothetical protein
MTFFLLLIARMTSQEINATIPTLTPAPIRTIFPPETYPGGPGISADALDADSNDPNNKMTNIDKDFVIFSIINIG